MYKIHLRNGRLLGFLMEALVFLSLFFLILGLGLWAELLGILVVLAFLILIVLDLQSKENSLKKRVLFLLSTAVWVVLSFYILWWGVQTAIELQSPKILIDEGLWPYYKASFFAFLSFQAFLLWLYGCINVFLCFMILLLQDKYFGKVRR